MLTYNLLKCKIARQWNIKHVKKVAIVIASLGTILEGNQNNINKIEIMCPVEMEHMI